VWGQVSHPYKTGKNTVLKLYVSYP
jgi:hypothetical protein